MREGIKKGQVWSYKTRKGEEKSLLTILDITSISEGNLIAHIEISDVNIKDLNTGDILSHSIAHMPFDMAILKRTLIGLKFYKQISSNEGYLYWKLQYEKGKAGVWSIDIAEAIELTEKSYNK